MSTQTPVIQDGGPLGIPLLVWTLVSIVVIAVAIWAITRTVRAARAKAPRIEVNLWGMGPAKAR